MYVCFKRGDQREEGNELYRKYRQKFGGEPPWSARPDFPTPIPGLGVTITVIDRKWGRGWWEDRLLERGWLGMDSDRWELALRAAVRIEEHHPGGLRGFLSENHA